MIASSETTKQEFKQREALYKHLLKLKVPHVLAELIAVSAHIEWVGLRFFGVANYIHWCIHDWVELPEGEDFWRGVYEDAWALTL